ncbi:MAG TPA: hypothetical protein VEB66_08205 [Opitutaceae bacterium]|nr:hypothetical protein [Opitutaceae bacterium]
MNRPSPFHHRLFALLCVGLVLALGVAGVSDRLHAELHAAPSGCGHAHAPELPAPDQAAHDATCAVELFAAGVSLPVDPAPVVIGPRAPIAKAVGRADVFVAPTPARLQPPGRGPPQA